MEIIMIKRIWMLALCVLLAVSVLGGCSAGKKTDKLTIVATVFPAYDWMREILGENSENVDLILLLDDGVDMHSYQPTVDDIVTVSTCDMFIYVGGESDGWVADALAEAKNENMVVVDLMDVLGDAAKEEEVVEGMEAEEDAEEETAYDEHVWLSLKNAQVFVRALTDSVIQIDSEHQDIYAANRDAYIEKLADLDAQYQAAVDASPHKTVLFGDRFPFRYLTDDYGLSYYAAFAGCSAETEASFDTVIFLASKVDELNLPAILTIEGSDGKIAKTIQTNATKEDVDIVTLNSMQNISKADADKVVTYLSIMQENLGALQKALF